MNDFFSRFETLHYSLNSADDTFIEPAEDASLQEKELMATRRIELNDKLKAVLLNKSIEVDESHQRDILAKVDFNKEPKPVYEATKIAIRDICGSLQSRGFGESSDKVLLTKPWQSDQRRRSRSWSQRRGSSSYQSGGKDRSQERYRDRSSDRRRDRSFERRDRSQSRERGRARSPDRSKRGNWNQGGDTRSVSFRERRDSTPVPGRIDNDSIDANEVLVVVNSYDEVFINDEDFIENERKGNQLMILDIGCPRSLQGENEFRRLKDSLSTNELKELKVFSASERFKFGPSRLYDSEARIEVTLRLRNVKVKGNFFIFLFYLDR